MAISLFLVHSYLEISGSSLLNHAKCTFKLASSLTEKKNCFVTVESLWRKETGDARLRLVKLLINVETDKKFAKVFASKFSHPTGTYLLI